MNWRNTNDSYGLIAKLFHWALAVLIIGLIAFGMYLGNAKISVSQLYLYGWHKALGLLAFTFISLRVLWRIRSHKPAPLDPGNWQAKLAHSIHRILYFLMVLMPLSGWIASSASGFPMSFFGLFPLPAIAPTSEPLEEFFFAVHGIAGKLLVLSLLLHLGGALQRHFVKRDGTMRRMWF